MIEVAKFGKLAKAADNASNHEEAYGYYARILEIDPENADAWIGKALAAGWMSKLGRDRFSEVVTGCDEAIRLSSPEARTEWLLIEWPADEKEPTRYTLTTLPRKMSTKAIVRMTKERYRTEQVYEEMKGELGLDHFEGRGYPGWCHHVTLTLCCYAFLVAERASAFSPSAGGTLRAHALEAAA